MAANIGIIIIFSIVRVPYWSNWKFGYQFLGLAEDQIPFVILTLLFGERLALCQTLEMVCYICTRPYCEMFQICEESELELPWSSLVNNCCKIYIKIFLLGSLVFCIFIYSFVLVGDWFRNRQRQNSWHWYCFKRWRQMDVCRPWGPCYGDTWSYQRSFLLLDSFN